MVGDGSLSLALARDYRTATLSEPDRAMLDYAVKVTRTPHTVTPADIAQLRDLGFEDAAILDICQVASYYNYVNRLADGLGVEMEDAWSEEELTIGRAEFGERLAERHAVEP